MNEICPPSAINKWIETYPFLEACDWKTLFTLPYKITKEPFLQSFQYKLLNRIINTNDKLLTWRIKETNICEYCNEIDTIEHHFFWCVYSSEFWKKIQKWSKDNLDTSMDFTVCEILFGICIDNNESFNIINFLILLGKQFINKSRTNKEPLYFIKFISLLKNKIENIIYTKIINSQDVKGWERDLADAL